RNRSARVENEERVITLAPHFLDPAGPGPSLERLFTPGSDLDPLIVQGYLAPPDPDPVATRTQAELAIARPREHDALSLALDIHTVSRIRDGDDQRAALVARHDGRRNRRGWTAPGGFLPRPVRAAQGGCRKHGECHTQRGYRGRQGRLGGIP